MTHVNGVQAEKHIKSVLEKEGLNIKVIHQPVDFLVNNKIYLEIKSCKFLVKRSNKDNYYQNGRYECWHKKQLDKLLKINSWVCFVIEHRGQYIIQGFLKSKNLPNSRVIGHTSLERVGLRSLKQFIQYINETK